MDLASLYSDREKYPDAMTIEIQGEKMSLKDWRDGLGLKSEFTKHSQKSAETQKSLENALQQREASLQQMQGQLAQMMAARGVNPANAESDDLSIFRNDPQFKPLITLVESQKKMIDQLAQRQQMDEVAVNSWRYEQQLDRLGSEDKELNREELAKFAHDLWSKGPDLDKAYKLHTYDKTIKSREEAAEKRGYEKAKAEPPMPIMPGGRRGSSGKAPLELPKDLNARVEMAKNDPEIAALWTGE